MKVLMVGATLNYARHILRELKKGEIKVRALVRNRDIENLALERGADETTIVDLRDGHGLISASVGVGGVFYMGSAFALRESDIGTKVVAAAKAAGVNRFVFSSVMHPSLSKLSNHASKCPVEEALYESGMTFTVLQPAIFMQTMERGWNEVVRSGRFCLPYSRLVKMCFVDFREVAEVAALAFTSQTLDNGTFELCAPGMFNREEITALMNDALGFRVEPGEISFDAWADTKQISDGPVREELSHMYAEYDQHGFRGGNAVVLRCLLGREPHTLKEFFRELAVRHFRAGRVEVDRFSD